MDKAAFRSEFPEFSSTTVYPDAQLDFWAGVAESMVREVVWKGMFATGVKLYVAHEITLAAQNKKTSTAGGAPGTFGGVPTNKTVGSASIGFDASTTTEKDAGWWNLTTYGKQYIRLARIFGAGCVQL